MSSGTEPRTPWVGDDEASRRLLRRVFHATAIGSGVLGVVTLVAGEWIGLALSLMVLALSLAMLPVVRRGGIGLAGAAFAGSLFLVATYSIARTNGIHDIAMLIYPVLLMVGAVLLERNAYRLLAAGSVLATVSVGLAEIRGLVRTPFTEATDLEDIVIVSTVLTVAAVIARLLVRSVRQALRQAVLTERSYREIFDATDESIFVHHPETGEVLDVNATATAMFRCSRQELLALAYGRFTAAEAGFDSARALAAVRRAAAGEPQALEWRSRRADGTEFWTEVSLRPVELLGELRVLALVRDVDERRQLEERARQDDKLRSLGLLAGGVAHDFNNQLTAIVGYADALRSSEDPDLREAAEAILAAARRSTELTRQLLAFARRSPLRRAPVDLRAMVEELVRLLERSIDKRIAVVARLDATPAWVIGDPSLLQNALLNLALNARDAMPKGGRLVLATRATEGPLEPDRPAAPVVELTVSDTGSGMTAEVASRIFEPFYTTKERGTGMGLAAAYGTVRAHGGRIDVVSAPERGTTFTVRLPRHEGASSPVHAGAAAGTSLSGVRVLVVDDEPFVLGATRRVLERVGCAVTTAGDGREALERLGDGPERFDAVVLDHVMPGLSGPEVLAELRRRAPGLGVILVSGYAKGAEWTPDDDRGLVRLPKPFEPEELVRAVGALAGRPGDAELR